MDLADDGRLTSIPLEFEALERVNVVQPMLLRGIAWAAKKPVDALKDVVKTDRRSRGPAGLDRQN